MYVVGPRMQTLRRPNVDANVGESESSIRHFTCDALASRTSELLSPIYMTGNSQGNENLGFVLMIPEMAVRIGCGSHQAYTAILLCNIILSSICKNGIFLRKAKVENFSLLERLVEIISILIICSKAQYKVTLNNISPISNTRIHTNFKTVFYFRTKKQTFIVH